MGMPYVMIMIMTAVLLLYSAAIVRMIFALSAKPRAQGRNDGDDNDLPGVSVVIPFRNEERNLAPLLESLMKQSYKGTTEVIFVNDSSDDGGAGVIEKYIWDNGNVSIKVVDLNACDMQYNDMQQFKRLTTKQQALDSGVGLSSHPLIAFTDADMILDPDWISSLVDSHLSTGADLVFGHTSVIKKNDPLSAFEAYQLEFLFAFAYAFAKSDMTGSCMGNNLLFTKESYLRCGGQRGIGRSIVEDRALLETMRRCGFKTAAAEPFRVTATTYPSQSFKRFLDQMTRWTVGGLRPGGGLFAAAALMLTQNTAFALTAAGAAPPAIPALISIINFLLTWVFLAAAFRKTRSPARALAYPIYYIFMMMETALFGWILIFKRKAAWKGRVIT